MESEGKKEEGEGEGREKGRGRKREGEGKEERRGGGRKIEGEAMAIQWVRVHGANTSWLATKCLNWTVLASLPGQEGPGNEAEKVCCQSENCPEPPKLLLC